MKRNQQSAAFTQVFVWCLQFLWIASLFVWRISLLKFHSFFSDGTKENCDVLSANEFHSFVSRSPFAITSFSFHVIRDNFFFLCIFVCFVSRSTHTKSKESAINEALSREYQPFWHEMEPNGWANRERASACHCIKVDLLKWQQNEIKVFCVRDKMSDKDERK